MAELFSDGNVYGGEGNDHLTLNGSFFSSLLSSAYGGAGDDTLSADPYFGSGSTLFLTGGAGNDIYTGLGQTDNTALVVEEPNGGIDTAVVFWVRIILWRAASKA